MPYYPTLEEDVARAKEILAKGQPSTWEKANFTPDVVEALRQVGGGTIYGGDVYAAYKLLESFVQAIEQLQAQTQQQLLNNVALRAELAQFCGLFSDYEEPCEGYLHAQAIWNAMKERENKLHAEIARLREDRDFWERKAGEEHVLVEAVGRKVCELALRHEQKRNEHMREDGQI